MATTCCRFAGHGFEAAVTYMPEKAFKTYIKDYVEAGAECPPSFMHHNVRKLILMPASRALEQELAAYRFAPQEGGTPYELVGHKLVYESSTEDGNRLSWKPRGHGDSDE